MQKTMTYQLAKVTQTALQQCRRTVFFGSHLSSIFPHYWDWKDSDSDWKNSSYFHSNIINGQRAVPMDLILFYNEQKENRQANLLYAGLEHYIQNLELVEAEKNKLYTALLAFAEETFVVEDMQELLKALPAEASVDALATLWSRLVWMAVIFDHKPKELQAQLLRKEAS